MDRVIGRYDQGEEGPLLITLGAVHGNEDCGVEAAQLLLKMLEVEPITNPSFTYRGAFVGLIGNLKAYAEGVRFIDRDLNRMWKAEHIKTHRDEEKWTAEHEEQQAIIKVIHEEAARYKPTEIIIIDLHSTSSSGGIFSIPALDKKSLELAKALNVPVITHMMDELSGTSLHYFSNSRVQGVSTTAVAFEAGQHGDPRSVNRCIAAIINCMAYINAVNKEDVENVHNEILTKFSAPHPKESRLIYKHQVKPGDQFRMKAGYQNFQYVRKGELLAHDKNGPIHAIKDGLILMPLYQKQGEDGFFIINKSKL